MPLATGQILKDRYRIVRLLGQGGFGAVYRAWDTVLERPCAVKENLDPSPAAGRQFQREAKILARLDHPNLPDVKDYFVLPGQGQYLVMDYVEGDDLEKLLPGSGGKIPEEQALGWIVQVCEALEYLHSQNPPVIHRDIKPANIKLAANGQVKLVDFGIAKASDPSLSTMSGAQAATPGYAPFEQYGQEPTDARSDIYSLGATLYTLLTGQPPLESIARVGGRTLTNPSQLNPSITPGTEAAVLKALALHPEGRYQSAAEFRHSLSLPERGAGVRVSSTVQVIQLGGEQSQPFTEPLPPHPELQKSRPSWLLPAGVGLAAVVCLAGLVWIIASLIQPAPGTPPPLTRLETASAAAVVETDMPVGIASPPAAPTTQADFTPTARHSPTTAVPVQQVDEKGLAKALVPAGEFQMGSDADEGLAECQKFRSDCQRDWFVDEEPVHSVFLDAFYIDVYEVTNVAFQQCVRAGECSTPRDTTYYQDSDSARHPVVYVDWSQARAYCQWRGGDLPTEAQWEKAARGGLDEKLYPWGDEAPVCEEGAENGAQFSSCGGQTVEVGGFSPNGYGLYDMAGNVWEWVLDWYLDTFYAGSPPENPSGPGSGESRVLRGGSWSSYELALRVASRGSSVPVGGHDGFGFRCAFSP